MMMMGLVIEQRKLRIDTDDASLSIAIDGVVGMQLQGMTSCN